MWQSKRSIIVGVIVAAILTAGGATLVSKLNKRGPAAVGQAPGGQAAQPGASEGAAHGYQTYANPEPRFSFRYPNGFTVTPVESADGGTLLVRATGAVDRSAYRDVEVSRLQFQIRISEFDTPTQGEGAGGGGPITAERIRQDIPDMVIENPQYVILSASEGSRDSPASAEAAAGESASPQNDGGISPQNDVSEGVRALAFLSKDESLGATREVWFAASGYLYQITAYPEADEVLGEILKTWQFQ